MPSSASAYTGASPNVSSAATKIANPTTVNVERRTVSPFATVATEPVIAPTP